MNKERVKSIFESLWEDFDKVDLRVEDWDLKDFGLHYRDEGTLGDIAERLGEVFSEEEAQFPICIWAREHRGSVYLTLEVFTPEENFYLEDCT